MSIENIEWNKNTSVDIIHKEINPKKIKEDSEEIEKFVLKTPLIRLNWLDTPNRKVWAKLECNQLTNSFKVRGAYNTIRKIDPSIPIVTNSAGNHGLAMAYTIWKLGRKGKIFVPVNASEIKLRRLINMGVEVIPVGKDLYECGEIAKKVAKEINGVYVSPYSTKDVIIGQGSVAVEVLKEKENFDHVLIPLGGGGLFVGAGMYFKDKDNKCKINAIHPKVFHRDFNENYYNAFSKSVYPTIADGLAVQHSEDDFTADLVKEIADSIEEISEDDIEMGIVAMLNNEGILVEGAGAIGISALINDPEGEKYNGDVLVVVSGGNIATSSLMHALAIHTENNKVGKLLGFNSVKLPQEAVEYKSMLYGNNIDEIQEDISIEEAWDGIIKNLNDNIIKFEKELKEHIEYVEDEKLNINYEVIKHIENELNSLKSLISNITKEMSIVRKRDIYRVAVQEYSFLRNSLAWCSASSSQSQKIMFFSPAENNENAVNYDRYGSLLLREREIMLQKSLGFDIEKTDLLMTSSGQAAYTVVESFLLRKALSKNPTIVSCPYIYFENLEQIQALKHINFIVSEKWDLQYMIDLVEKNSAEALFIDPLANLGTLHTTDFRKLAKLLEGHDWSNKWLVVDGTMVSGGLNLFEIFNKPNHPHILYFESGSKYLQLGMDLQMTGIVVAEKEYFSELTTHRRNTGGVMYQSGVTKFPTYDRKQYLARMLRLTRNSELLYNTLKELNTDKEKVLLTFPTNWRELGWKHGGGIVAVNFVEAGLNNRPCLDFLIDLIIEECKKREVPFTKGVSFGFSTIRISAAAAMAQGRPPFLRFSIGEESEAEMKEICIIIKEMFNKFFEQYNI